MLSLPCPLQKGMTAIASSSTSERAPSPGGSLHLLLITETSRKVPPFYAKTRVRPRPDLPTGSGHLQASEEMKPALVQAVNSLRGFSAGHLV